MKVITIVDDLEVRLTPRGIRLLPSQFKALEGMLPSDFRTLAEQFQPSPGPESLS